MSHGTRWLRDLTALVEPHGWRCVRATNHLIFRGPSGNQVVVSASPSDRRHALKNAKKDFRNQGCPLR